MKEINIDATIVTIVDSTFKDNDKEYGKKYNGLIINTDKGKIKIGIDNHQQYHEQWGYEFDFEPHVVTKLEEDKRLQYYKNKHINKIMMDFTENTDYNGDTNYCFINIYFDKYEKIKMTIFNYHNGYYSHKYLIEVFGEEIDSNYI